MAAYVELVGGGSEEAEKNGEEKEEVVEKHGRQLKVSGRFQAVVAQTQQ